MELTFCKGTIIQGSASHIQCSHLDTQLGLVVMECLSQHLQSNLPTDKESLAKTLDINR
jgi:hypothetical protein